MGSTLNDQAWYRLPDGTAVIADVRVDKDGTFTGYGLYTAEEWNSTENADREVQADGRVTFQGKPTGWTTADLVPI